MKNSQKAMKKAFKLTTKELHDAQIGSNNSEKGFGPVVICNEYNKGHLSV